MREYICLLMCFFSCLTSSAYAITQEELLEYAINQNDGELLDAVFKHPGCEFHPSLNLAMDAKDYFSVFMFVEYGVDINSRRDCVGEYLPKDQFRSGTGRTVLESAMFCEEIALVEYFLLKGADPTSKRSFQEGTLGTQGFVAKTNYVTTAVYDAIVQNRLDVMMLFIDYGLDLNKICHEVKYLSNKTITKMTPMKAALFHKRKDIGDWGSMEQ
jgi:hypothetical protein